MPTDYEPLWNRVGSRFRGTPHERYEAFMQYAEEHPDEVIEAIAFDAEASFEAQREAAGFEPTRARRAASAPMRRHEGAIIGGALGLGALLLGVGAAASSRASSASPNPAPGPGPVVIPSWLAGHLYQITFTGGNPMPSGEAISKALGPAFTLDNIMAGITWSHDGAFVVSAVFDGGTVPDLTRLAWPFVSAQDFGAAAA